MISISMIFLIKWLFKMKWLNKISLQKWSKELCSTIERKFNFSTTQLSSKISLLKNYWFWTEIFVFVEENTIKNFSTLGKVLSSLTLTGDGKMLNSSWRKRWIFWGGSTVLPELSLSIWRIEISEAPKIGMVLESSQVSN